MRGLRRRGANRAGIVKWIQKEEEEENGRRISTGGSEGHVRTQENIYIYIYTYIHIYTLRCAEDGKRKHVWGIYGVRDERGGRGEPK